MKLKKIILFILSAIIFTLIGFIFGQKKLNLNNDFVNKTSTKIEFLKEIIDESYILEFDEKNIQEEIYKGFFRGLDEYSKYLTKEEFEEVRNNTKGRIYGIGIIAINNDDKITIIDVIKGSPADKSGLSSGDQILSVNGENVSNYEFNEVMIQIRGEEGSIVSLQIKRNGKEFDFKISREAIKEISVNSDILDNNIGYISISTFNENTDKEFKESIDGLISKDIKSFIIDLRSNGGGVVKSALSIADMLLPKGPILYQLEKNKEEIINYSDKEMYDIEIVVLINQQTASSSEILSAALKDYERAILIGEKTFGKGIFQNVWQLDDGSSDGIILTTGEWLGPKKNKIHKVGIEPDVFIPLEKGVKIIGLKNLENDNQLQEAIKYLSN